MDRYAKAIVGAVMAGLGALGAALADSSITATEWVVVASAVLGALALVWAVPNASARPGFDRIVDTDRPGLHERLMGDDR